MKIAIPYDNGQLHAHFGGCREFALVDVDVAKKIALRTQVLPAPEHQPGNFPRWLRAQGVEWIIAGGIGRHALEIFARHGITVRGGPPHTSIGDLVSAFLNGELKSAPKACVHHHEHGHSHHHGHCHETPEEQS